MATAVPELPRNTQRRNVVISIAVACGGIAMVLAGVYAVDIIEGGGALIFGGLVVFPTGLIVSRLFVSRARVMDDLLSGRGVLASWAYDPAQWRQAAEKEFKEAKGEKGALFLLVAATAIGLGLLLVISERNEAAVWTFGILMGVVAIVAVAAWLSAWLPYRHAQRGVGRTIIALSGAYVNGQLHSWRGWGARLEGVEYRRRRGLLVITHSILMLYGRAVPGRNYTTVRVPVPPGEEQTAEGIVTQLGREARHGIVTEDEEAQQG